jgi:hypothetical protein
VKTTENKNGTISSIFQWTDRCGIDLVRNGAATTGWTLTFYDDGDPVVIEHIPRWQLEDLQGMINSELSRESRRKQ